MNVRTPILLAAVVATCMSLVMVRYESRMAFAELHQLDSKRDDLNTEYGRLLLERTTWSLHHLVEQAAVDRLSMHRPGEDAVIALSLPESDR